MVGSIVSRFGWLMIAALCILAVLVTTVMAQTGLAIARAMSKAITSCETIADGDLAGRVDSDGIGETRKLLESIERMRTSVATAVGAVRANAESVATASAQLAQGNQDLSQRTEVQASALEETAASMEELSSTVKQSADNARQTSQLAISASAVAIKGGEVVSEVVATM